MGARVSYHPWAWYVHVASVFPLACGLKRAGRIIAVLESSNAGKMQEWENFLAISLGVRVGLISEEAL